MATRLSLIHSAPGQNKIRVLPLQQDPHLGIDLDHNIIRWECLATSVAESVPSGGS